jgi:glycosyltransferase involved in cell wall biosynthesis
MFLNKHILFISSEPFCPEKMPLASIYVLDQVELIKPYFGKVGLLAVAYLPSSNIFLHPKFYRFNNTYLNGVIYNSAVKKKLLPLKFISHQRRYDSLVTYALEVFSNYIDKYGIPDLVHAHNSFFGGLVACEIKKKFGVPFVLTEHSSVMYGKLTFKEINWFRNIFSQSDILISVSLSLANRLYKQLEIFDRLKSISVVPNALNPLYEKSINLKKKGSNTFNFITVGNLVDVKNHILLLKAFSLYFKFEKQVKLVIVGDGPLRNKLLTYSSELGIKDQVEFTGYLDKNVVRTKMIQSDVFVLSSRHETFGIVVMEALSCGLPVISTPCQGPLMLVNEINGRIVDDHTPESLGKMMLVFRRNEIVWDSMIIRNKCIIDFGAKSFVEKILGIYKHILIK